MVLLLLLADSAAGAAGLTDAAAGGAAGLGRLVLAGSASADSIDAVMLEVRFSTLTLLLILLVFTPAPAAASAARNSLWHLAALALLLH